MLHVGKYPWGQKQIGRGSYGGCSAQLFSGRGGGVVVHSFFRGGEGGGVVVHSFFQGGERGGEW